MSEERYKGSSFTLQEIWKIVNDIKAFQPYQSLRNRINGLITMLQISNVNRAVLVEAEFGLVPRLIQLLASSSDLGTKRAIVITFAEFAVLKENQILLAQKSLGLAALIRRQGDYHDFEFPVYLFFLNCAASSAETHDYLLSKEVGFAMYARGHLLQVPDNILPYWFFANIAALVSQRNISLLFDLDIPKIFLNRLIQQGCNPKLWADRLHGTAHRAMFTLFYLSVSSEEACKRINGLPGIHSYLFSLFNSNERERLVAAILLCNLSFSHDEDCQSSSKLQSYFPELLDLLLMIFYDIIHFNRNQSSEQSRRFAAYGYCYGVFKLCTICASLRRLALKEDHRSMMINHPNLLSLCNEALLLFLDNEPECSGVSFHDGILQYGGGGGDDHVSLERIIELLLLLSFQPSESHPEHKTPGNGANGWRNLYCSEALQFDVVMTKLLHFSEERGISDRCSKMIVLLIERMQS